MAVLAVCLGHGGRVGRQLAPVEQALRPSGGPHQQALHLCLPEQGLLEPGGLGKLPGEWDHHPPVEVSIAGIRGGGEGVAGEEQLSSVGHIETLLTLPLDVYSIASH